MPDTQGIAGPVAVRRLEPCGMVLFRGDLAGGRLAAVLQAVSGTEVPGVRGIVQNGDRAVAWMSPDELLIMLPADAAAHAVEKFGAKLGAEHHLAVDVSALRVMYEISGAGAREVLAKGTPADVSPEALPEGVFCRSRVGQVQAAFWSAGDDAFRIICRRSEAEYLKDWLTAAAAPGTVPEYFNA